MIRLVNTLCFICLVGLIVALYHIRYSAETEARALRRIEARIMAAKDRRDTLNAEWSSLNDPRRLQALSEQHLSLYNVEAHQIIDMRPDARRAMPVLMRGRGQ